MKMTRFAFPELKLTRRYLAAVIFTSIAASTSIGFTAITGIDTNVVFSSKGLAQMIIDRVGW